jgi:predicted NAD/FAD-dependent oxidoreductase
VAEAGPFDAVVVAVPAEQAVGLLEPVAAEMAAQAREAVTAPCWAGLFAFETSIEAPFGAARLADHDVLAWVACEQGKRDRPGPEAWVVHATPEWSRRHLEAAPEDVAAVLLSELHAMCPAAPAPLYSQAHRWRYAQVAHAAGTPFAWDAALGLGVCGDWRLGPRVEAAWLSGHGLAAAMLA